MDTKNVIKTSMQKSIKYICAILLLVGMTGKVWGATYTYDFSSCVASSGGNMNYWYSNSGCNTYLAKYTSGTTNQIISSGGSATIYYKDATISSTAFGIYAANTAYFMSGSTSTTAFFFGKTGSYITLPTFSSQKITNVTVTTSSTVAGSVEVNIYSGSDAASTSKTTTSNTSEDFSFDISSTYQLTTLTLKIVTSDKNFQLTKIVITTAPAGYAVTYNNGGHGTAPSSTTATSVTLSAITADGYTCTGWTADKAVAVGGDSKTAGTLLTNGSIVTLSQATTFTAQWSTNEYIVLLEDGDGSGGDGGVEVTYDANTNLTSSVTVPTRAGYTFAGYYTEENGNGEQLIGDNGAWIASVSGYTDASKNWKYADDLSLYAKWIPNNYKLSVGEPGHVAIKATPEDKTDIAEGSYDAAVPCGAIVALSATVDDGYSQAGWKITKDEDGSDVTEDYLVDDEMFMPPFDASVTATMYGGYRFSCSELTLTPKLVTAGTPIFITSAASKTVRSQDSILIVGSGLTPGQALEFPGLNAKFTVKSRVNGTLSVKADGTIDTVAYIFYTPGATTEDGLDKLLGITVKVGGGKPKQVNLTQDIIGRHLPAAYVIAGKKDNKWYALPSNMVSTTNPKPSEIAVDDINNPSIAYTAASNIYGLEGPTTSGVGNNIASGNGQYVRLTMSIDDGTNDPHAAPLFGSSSGTRTIGKSGNSQASSDLSAGWWWKLQQMNTSVSDPQDAKYKIYCANNTSTLSLRDNAGNPDWGFFASGIEELRIIPASDVEFTESEVVVWAQKKLILEIAKPNSATQARAMITDGSWSTYKSLATTTGTSVKGSATKYNYTLDFTSDDFDFAANEGKMLIVELLDSEGSPLKASSVLIPRIIAADRTINYSNDPTKGPWNTEVHVLPGVTLTLDASAYTPATMTIKELNVYPGATVIAEKGTLIATTLVLRNGWNRLTAEKEYNVARLFITPTTGNLQATNAYSDWYIDYDQYYPIAVPWEVTTGGMRYMNTNSTVQAGVTMKYYDGASRAANVQSGVGAGANWKTYSRTVEAVTYSYPEILKPGHGYAMTARRPAGKAFSIIRMPLTIPSAAWTTAGEKGTVGEAPSDIHKDTVRVYAYGDGSTPEYAKGWNFIANPYMSVYAGELSYTDGGEVQYANIPDINFREYDQLPIETTKLKPSSGFLIQAPKDGTVTFGTTHRAVAAPAYRTETPAPDVPTQKAYIRLNGEEAEDMMGLIVDEQYTAAYEANADLQKLLGDGTSLRTYLQYDNMDMAFLAVNSVLAQAWIPVTVRIPTAGTYTYSMHYASRVGELEGVYLMDYLTGQMTNLLDNNYTFTIEAGTTDNRFALNAIVGERQLPTDMDVAEMTGGEVDTDRPVKFIYHDQVYILYRNCIYDATGKQVRKMNR